MNVRLTAPASMFDQAFFLQHGHVFFDLSHRFTESVGNGVERMPKDSVPAGPADRALIEPLLPVRQITLPAHDVRPLEATDLVPGIEWFADFQAARGRTAVFPRRLV